MSRSALAISHHPSQGCWPILCWVLFRHERHEALCEPVWVLSALWVVRGGPLGRTFPWLCITPNKWKNKAESSHADSLTTGHLHTSAVIFLPTIIWCVYLPSSPKQADPITHKGICSLISCPFHPEKVLTQKFLKTNSNVPFPTWIVTGSHPRYLFFFPATTTLLSHKQSPYKQWLANFTGFTAAN